MYTRFFVMVVFGFLMVTQMAFAREDHSILGVIARMTVELNLTDEQVQKVTPIVKANILKRQEYIDRLQGEAIVNNAKFKKTSRQFRKEMNVQLLNVLTPSQMQKLIEKQNIRESLNKDVVDFSEGLSGAGFNPQGASLAF